MLVRVPQVLRAAVASGPIASLSEDPAVTARISSPRRRREQRVLAITAVLALGAPLGSWLVLRSRTDELATRLGEAGGVPARIGAIDADLTGTLRLSEVALGELVSADAIEASVGMGSLLRGQLRADEIRVASPHVAIQIGTDGDSDLARLARKLLGSGPASAPRARSGTGVRRIVVAGGTLTADLVGIGELAADGVELVPDAGGARVLTGPVRITRVAQPGTPHVELAFARSAAEVTLPTLHVGRVLAVGGTGRVSTGRADDVALVDLAAGRRSASAPLELRGAIDDRGVPRAFEVDLARGRGALAITLRGERVPLAMFAPLAPRGLELEAARASGRISVELPDDAGTTSCSLAGSVEQLVLSHPAVAPDKVTLSAGARAEVSITPSAITVSTASLQLGAIDLSVAGWTSRGAIRAGTLELALTPAPCEALLASLPAPIRGPLDGAVLTGSIGGRLRLVVDLAAVPGEGTKLTSERTGTCTVTSEPPAADVTMLTRASEQQLADGTRVKVGKGEPGWVALRGLPSHVTGAFVSAEDGRFWNHPGFDLEQIARSLEIDLRESRLARGGSTISQQLIKNAFLSQRRSFDRKLQEAILTWRLEERLEKRQILERYLNIIELGPRVFGIAAAARYWFDRTPDDLTIRQAAFLAALTSQPTSMSRRVRRTGGLDPDSAERVAVVMRAMRRDGVIDKAAHDDAKGSPLGFATTAIE
ncbi:MAG: biosynthetic peptidoglycan transglycosylase [Kofleriaceae bacterium]